MTSIKPDKNDASSTSVEPEAPKDELNQAEMDDAQTPFSGLPTSLNEELEEKVADNPNKFIGCGG